MSCGPYPLTIHNILLRSIKKIVKVLVLSKSNARTVSLARAWSGSRWQVISYQYHHFITCLLFTCKLRRLPVHSMFTTKSNNFDLKNRNLYHQHIFYFTSAQCINLILSLFRVSLEFDADIILVMDFFENSEIFKKSYTEVSNIRCEQEEETTYFIAWHCIPYRLVKPTKIQSIKLRSSEKN